MEMNLLWLTIGLRCICIWGIGRGEKIICLQATAYLDTALVWDSLYVPAYIQYSELLSGSSQADEARQWLNKALKIDPEFAPIYSAYARLENTRFLNEEITEFYFD